ncbi:MAG TPA: carboxypeptidase-like regulatory domain-containing protein [Gemmatimonadaceae bacterium]|nr:carboxypeptidase-like regulatory domain-containing protein [Gemmatimonadaceae bacterium]
MRLVAPLCALAITAGIASTAGAQTAPNAFVRVTATDSATGAPLASAEITLTRGLHDVVARGTTDDQGHGILPVSVKDSTDFNVTIRKIGFRRGDRFFDVGPKDTANLVLRVPSTTNTLGAVQVTASRSPSRFMTYELDADEIESADRPSMDNGWEVVKQLRPAMLESKGGCATGVQEIWVNGKHIRLPLRPTGMAAARALVGVPPGARFTYPPVTVLSEIAPEHIEHITYKDCFDHSMAVVATQNAIFVTLKPGVVYQQDVGSFVVDQTQEQQEKAAAKR